MKSGRKRGIAALCIVVATGALAHSGVKNAAVKARMQAKGSIGQNTGILGNTYRGTLDVDDFTDKAQDLQQVAVGAADIDATPQLQCRAV